MDMNPSILNDVAPTSHTLKGQLEVCIRMGSPNDASRLVQITGNVIKEGNFVVTEPGEFDLEEEQERAWIGRHLVDEGHLILVAEVGEQVVGFLHFQNGYRKRLKHRGRFHMLIDDEWRNQGVGSALIKTMLEWTESHPEIEKVCFAVFSNNTGAISLYKKFGFLEEGRRIGEIKLGADKFVDDVLMYKWVGPNNPAQSS
jgi:RimJ/RimL family protein N-acetyltransferase